MPSRGKVRAAAIPQFEVASRVPHTRGIRRYFGRPTDVEPLIFACAIGISFIGVLWGTLGFPLGTQADEAAKVVALQTGRNPSFHPLLMLQIIRVANAWTVASDPQAIVELGRACALVAGGLAVVASFLLAREILPRILSLAVAGAVAVLPLMTVHARYFKEDIFAVPFIVLALFALIRTLKLPSTNRGILLGVTIGLAAAAKYIAAILLPFSVAVLLLNSGFTDRKVAILFIALVASVALAVFVLIEIPVLWELTQFRNAVLFELSHAAHGHDVKLPLSLTHGIFHLRESLLPGLGLPLLTLGMLGMTVPLWGSPEKRRELFIIVTFMLVWYAAHEISPLKPFPGYARYMVPLAPLLVILGGAFLHELTNRYPVRGTYLAVAIIIGAALPALRTSVLVNGPKGEDLRRIIPKVLDDLQLDPSFDSYTEFMGLGRHAAAQESKKAVSKKLFVTSNFTYERYTRFGSTPEQSSETQALASYYNQKFQLPYLEVSNGRPSFAFFNPVLRIVALNGEVEALDKIAAALSRSTPRVKYSFRP